MAVDLQVMTSPGCLCRILFMVVDSSLTGISGGSTRGGGGRLGMMVGWL
jgi:hypothetical protein